MGGEGEGWSGLAAAPGGAPPYLAREEHWTHFDNSVNAISFGFVATAILVSMFLVMAIFEKFLRTTSPELPPSGGGRSDIEAQNFGGGFSAKLRYPSPKASTEVSVVMPGDNVPTYIAHLAPVPCSPERRLWPTHRPMCSPPSST